jgi:hypothetical protein
LWFAGRCPGRARGPKPRCTRGHAGFLRGPGFVPLEELPQVRGPDNPCLLLVKAL